MTESITCPQCQMTSYSQGDVKHRYCGNCHQYHDQMELEHVDTSFENDSEDSKETILEDESDG